MPTVQVPIFYFKLLRMKLSVPKERIISSAQFRNMTGLKGTLEVLLWQQLLADCSKHKPSNAVIRGFQDDILDITAPAMHHLNAAATSGSCQQVLNLKGRGQRDGRHSSSHGTTALFITGTLLLYSPAAGLQESTAHIQKEIAKNNHQKHITITYLDPAVNSRLTARIRRSGQSSRAPTVAAFDLGPGLRILLYFQVPVRVLLVASHDYRTSPFILSSCGAAREYRPHPEGNRKYDNNYYGLPLLGNRSDNQLNPPIVMGDDTPTLLG
ncbi:uncharacterized protein LOC104853104 [Fukomys damarensis]|uniref:uncharacterized protein LOC104853104 n=1 Tax=Fukomys damarensis TaxID=885580 RepID=UPI0014550418|nr:uncharacterized protein LOC104853104 [Fukomys damarensis]